MKLTNLYHAVLGTVVLVLALHVWRLEGRVKATRDWVAALLSDTTLVVRYDDHVVQITPNRWYQGTYEVDADVVTWTGITPDDPSVASSLADITGPGKISICGSPCTHEVTHKETYSMCSCCGVRLLTISKEGKND